jgi:hypothetical protein
MCNLVFWELRYGSEDGSRLSNGVEDDHGGVVYDKVRESFDCDSDGRWGF